MGAGRETTAYAACGSCAIRARSPFHFQHVIGARCGCWMLTPAWFRTANFVPFQKYNFAAENIKFILNNSHKMV